MPGLSDLTGGLGSSLGAVAGYFMGGDGRKKQSAEMQAAVDAYAKLDPKVREQVEATQSAGSTAMNNMAPDQTRGDQLDALSQLKSIYSQGGNDASAKMAQFQANSGAAQNAKAMNANIMQSAAQRGMAGGGASLAAQRSNAQAQAQQAAMQGQMAAAEGQSRQMQALGAYGQQAGQVRGQDAQAAQAKAAANDAFAQFNAANAQQVAGRNADRNLQAQQYTAQNGLGQANGGAAAHQAKGQVIADQNKQMQDAIAGIGGIAGTAAGLSDERAKRDIIRHKEEALPGVPVATWEYLHEPGKRYRGVIAQDLQRVAPEYVRTGADGLLRVNYAFAPGLFSEVA